MEPSLLLQGPRPQRNLESICHKTLDHGVLSHLDSGYAALARRCSQGPKVVSPEQPGSGVLPSSLPQILGMAQALSTSYQQNQSQEGLFSGQASPNGSTGECPVGDSRLLCDNFLSVFFHSRANIRETNGGSVLHSDWVSVMRA